jgi:hypothetical protein
MKRTSIAFIAIALAGCGSSETITVDLSPMPLTIKGEKGTSVGHRSPNDDFKMVRVDFPDQKSLALEDVTAGAQNTFALQKDKREGDRVLFPLKKWEKEEADRAIWRFEKAGKTGYNGFVFKVVAGRQYVCVASGLAGLPSVAEVEQLLKRCDSLAAK